MSQWNSEVTVQPPVGCWCSTLLSVSVLIIQVIFQETDVALQQCQHNAQYNLWMTTSNLSFLIFYSTCSFTSLMHVFFVLLLFSVWANIIHIRPACLLRSFDYLI